MNTLPHEELVKIIREYGEEHRAGAIARAIEKARVRGPITSTVQLAEIVSSVFPPYPPRRIHPATLTFQALRIAVNDELGSLREGLDRILPLLKPGGRIAVITFHSLEDRMVKQTFVKEAKGCICPPRLPVCACGKKPVLRILTRQAGGGRGGRSQKEPRVKERKAQGGGEVISEICVFSETAVEPSPEVDRGDIDVNEHAFIIPEVLVGNLVFTKSQ